LYKRRGTPEAVLEKFKKLWVFEPRKGVWALRAAVRSVKQSRKHQGKNEAGKTSQGLIWRKRQKSTNRGRKGGRQ